MRSRSRGKDLKTVDPPAPGFMQMAIHMFANTLFPNIDTNISVVREKATASIMLV